MAAAREILQAFHGGQLNRANQLTRPSGGILYARIFRFVSGYSNKKDISGTTIWDHCLPFTSGQATVLDRPGGAGLPYFNVLPVFLPDAWIHYQAVALPRSMMPFPPNGSDNSTTGLAGDMVTTSFDVGMYGPKMLAGSFKTTLGQNASPDATEDELWNLRLMFAYGVFHAIPVSQFYSTAFPVLSSFTNAFVPTTYQIAAPDWTTDGYQLQDGTNVSASTMCIARTDGAGRCIYPTMLAGPWSSFSLVETATTPASMPVWLLNGQVGRTGVRLAADSVNSSAQLNMLLSMTTANSAPTVMAGASNAPQGNRMTEVPATPPS
jgi:hypothetical protein